MISRFAAFLLWVVSLASTATFSLGASIAEADASGADGPLREIVHHTTSDQTLSVEDLVSVRDIRTLAVSPDGQHVAFQVDQADPMLNDYRSAWYIAPVERDADLRLADDAGPIHMFRTVFGNFHGNIEGWPAAWSPDGQWLAYLKKVEGAVQVWRVSRDRGFPEQLTRNPADVMDLVWGPDGSVIYFITGRDRDFMAKTTAMEAKRGFLFDERVNPALGATPLWSSCERKGFRFTLLSLTPSVRTCEPTVWVYDLASGEERRGTDIETGVYWAHRRFDSIDAKREGAAVRAITPSPDKASVAWLENMDPDTYSGWAAPTTVSVSRSTDRSDPLRCPDTRCTTGGIDNLWWRKRSGEVVFRRNEGHSYSINALYAWTPGNETVRPILQTDDLFRQCAMAGDRLICLYETWTRPARIVAIDLDTGSVETIFDVNPRFTAAKSTRIEKIEWSGPDGSEALGHLVYPAAYEKGHRYPLVVVGYLCTRYDSFLRGGTGDELPIHVMAQHGFAVLCFTRPFVPQNVGERLKSHEDAINQYLQISPLSALQEMIERLVKRGIIDRNRVGISGFSNGAILLEEAIVKSDDFSAASAAWSPSHPANYYLIHLSKLREGSRNRAGGEPLFGGLNYWTEKSPGVHAEKIRTPLLLQVADIEIFSALPNYFSLKDAGKPVEMYLFRDEYHVKWQPAHKYAVYKRNLQWFKFWLQGVEDPDPLDPEQYVRWRKLREQHEADIAAGDPATLN